MREITRARSGYPPIGVDHGVGDHDDRRVAHARHDAALGEKAQPDTLVGDPAGLQDLESHGVIEDRVAYPVDASHAAATNERLHDVVIEPVTGGEHLRALTDLACRSD